MHDPISISEAAKLLELTPNRVRALALKGRLPASKIGGRWLIERAAAESRRRQGGVAGRPFEPHNAWALLLLASGEQVDGIHPSVRSRLRRALAIEGLEGLRPRLVRRAEASCFSAHPGEISHLLSDPAIVATGISAAGDHGIDLVSGQEVDGYLDARSAERFAADHALVPTAPASGNVRLRLVQGPAWHLLSGASTAPVAAVALDLAEDPDPRSADAGQTLLRKLDNEIKI
jgi:excisionase family DNA binding protein